MAADGPGDSAPQAAVGPAASLASIGSTYSLDEGSAPDGDGNDDSPGHRSVPFSKLEGGGSTGGELSVAFSALEPESLSQVRPATVSVVMTA